MAIALDASTLGNANTSTVSHTCGTGSYRALFVVAGCQDKVTMTCTYNGVAMTELKSIQGTDSFTVVMFGLIAPASGAHDIVLSGATTNWRLAAASYTGVSPANLPDSSNSGSRTTPGTLSVSTTVVAANCWLICGTLGMATGGNPAVVSTNRTDRRTGDYANNASEAIAISDSNGVVATGAVATEHYETTATLYTLLGLDVSIAPYVPQTLTLEAETGAFTLTSVAMVFTKALTMAASAGSFVLTSISAVFTKFRNITQDTKAVSTFTQDDR